MKLTGFLLWIGESVLVTSVANAIFRFSYFQQKTKKVGDIKLAIVISIAEIVTISLVKVNNVLGLFGYFGIVLYPLEDAILSGLLVSLGGNFVYQIYKAISNYKDLLNTKKETEENFGKVLRRTKNGKVSHK